MSAITVAVDDSWKADEPARPAALLKGGTRGLEIQIDAAATVDAIADALIRRLDEAPDFFRGNDVRVRVIDGALPAGCLARLDDITVRYGLQIVEVGPFRKPEPEPEAAMPSAPIAIAAVDHHGGFAPAPAPPAKPAGSPPPLALLGASDPIVDVTADVADDVEPQGVRMVAGPIRSGVVLEHDGDLVIAGDVNPGADVRAGGNIVVLGRLRGVVHAGITRDRAFILALQLEPQQLRIGRQVARSAASDKSSDAVEIAYLTEQQIVVERYLGKLPRGLATSI
jgi:septum formation inhibitor MinC